MESRSGVKIQDLQVNPPGSEGVDIQCNKVQWHNANLALLSVLVCWPHSKTPITPLETCTQFTLHCYWIDA